MKLSVNIVKKIKGRKARESEPQLASFGKLLLKVETCTNNKLLC